VPFYSLFFIQYRQQEVLETFGVSIIPHTGHLNQQEEELQVLMAPDHMSLLLFNQHAGGTIYSSLCVVSSKHTIITMIGMLLHGSQRFIP
jgi:hypothetical protein